MKVTAPPIEHPSSKDLVAFAQGLLDPAQADVVGLHLSQCDLCAGKVDNAPDDDFIALLKAAERSVFGGDFGQPVDCEAETAKMEAASDLDRLPQELREHPRFKIERRLAAGAMGEVYLAMDSVLSRPVAVKVLKPELAGNPDRKQRFLQEARIAARLRHPNIVEVLHAAPAGESAYIVMEFVAGETLAEIVRRRGPLSVSEACAHVRQVAAGLACAEQHGVVHRDIKPQNLIFDPQTGLVKILDFGLGRLVDEHRSGPRLTHEGDILGTVNYLSPEQAEDPREADIRSDIYSLGCVCLYLLSGFPPFRSRNSLEVLKKHAEEAPPSLRALRPDVPPEIAALVEQMLAKAPALRPQSPAEIVAALSAAEMAWSAENGIRLETAEDVRQALEMHRSAAAVGDDCPLLFRPTLRPPTPLLTICDDGSEHGQQIRIRKDRFTIGRREGDLIISHDSQISGRHAELRQALVDAQYRWSLIDLQSTNGTYVRVGQAVLEHGQEFLIGCTRFRFEDQPAAGFAPPKATTAGDQGTRFWQPSATAGQSAILVELTETDTGARFVLKGPECWLGKDPDRCQIVLSEDPLVSPRHARICRQDDGRWVLENNKSVNGVWLRVEQIALKGTCRFMLGEQRFTIQTPP